VVDILAARLPIAALAYIAARAGELCARREGGGGAAEPRVVVDRAVEKALGEARRSKVVRGFRRWGFFLTETALNIV
jgi:hypothetical protein